jgi:hypothetical protein
MRSSNFPPAGPLALLALLAIPAPAPAQEIGMAAREAFADMAGSSNIVVHATVVDTSRAVVPFFRAGPFASIVEPPPGSSLVFAVLDLRVDRVLKGKSQGAGMKVGMPMRFLPGPAPPSALSPAGFGAATGAASDRIPLSPGMTAVFPLVQEPRSPGQWMLASPTQILDSEDGRVLGEDLRTFSIAARTFFAGRELTELVRRADAVVLGQVREVVGGCASRADTVFSCVTFGVSRFFNGEVDTLLTVTLPDVDRTSWRVPLIRQDVPSFVPDETFVLCLVRDPEGKWALLGGRSGAVRVIQGIVTEYPRDVGAIFGIHMDVSTFDLWVQQTLHGKGFW